MDWIGLDWIGLDWSDAVPYSLLMLMKLLSDDVVKCDVEEVA